MNSDRKIWFTNPQIVDVRGGTSLVKSRLKVDTIEIKTMSSHLKKTQLMLQDLADNINTTEQNLNTQYQQRRTELLTAMQAGSAQAITELKNYTAHTNISKKQWLSV